MAAVVFLVVFLAVCAVFLTIANLLPPDQLLWADLIIVVGLVLSVYAGWRASVVARRPQERRREMIERRGPCDTCRGSGRLSAPARQTTTYTRSARRLARCPDCRGRGY